MLFYWRKVRADIRVTRRERLRPKFYLLCSHLSLASHFSKNSPLSSLITLLHFTFYKSKLINKRFLSFYQHHHFPHNSSTITLTSCSSSVFIPSLPTNKEHKRMSSRAFRATPDSNYLVPRRSRDQQDPSPDRNRIWTEPPHKPTLNRKVPVVYYLCRNGQLDHPHFIEVTLSSTDGLYLKDVINRLNDLRGKGMASLYSWSSKRSYKNGFVWHDLSEDDFIFPVQGQEYVLKGSEVLDSCLLSNPRSLLGTTSFRDTSSLKPEKNSNSVSPVSRRRNQSWSSIDLSEYKVYKATESTAESTRRVAADASTQTEDRRRRRKPAKEEEVESPASFENQSTELSRDEISPPPSDSSPETLENLIKADGRLILRQNESASEHRTVESLSSGRMRASAVLMQLISCGTMSFKECGPVLLKDHGLSLTGRSGCTVTRGAGDNGLERAEKELESFGRVKLEDKEYFSGSLIETKKELVPALQRSSSYNADRSSRMGPTTEKDEEEAGRAKCIPRKPKSVALRNNGVHQ